MITKEILDTFYNNAKNYYELAQKDYSDTNDIKYLKEMCVHSGEMVTCKRLLKILDKETSEATVVTETKKTRKSSKKTEETEETTE